MLLFFWFCYLKNTIGRKIKVNSPKFVAILIRFLGTVCTVHIFSLKKSYSLESLQDWAQSYFNDILDWQLHDIGYQPTRGFITGSGTSLLFGWGLVIGIRKVELNLYHYFQHVMTQFLPFFPLVTQKKVLTIHKYIFENTKLDHTCTNLQNYKRSIRVFLQ